MTSSSVRSQSFVPREQATHDRHADRVRCSDRALAISLCYDGVENMTTPTLAQVANTVANARHSSASNEHFTPPLIVGAGRGTMGGIDLDPASCALANEVVQARGYHDMQALALPWRGPGATVMDPYGPARVFLNPPGGLLLRSTLEPLPLGPDGKPSRKGISVQDCVSAQAVWWSKLVHEWTIGNVEQAIFVCFNLEVLRLTQEPIAPFTGHTPAVALPICFLKDRPQYWNEATPADKRGRSGAPTHAGAVVYLPPRDCGTLQEVYLERFRTGFAPLGYVRI